VSAIIYTQYTDILHGIELHIQIRSQKVSFCPVDSASQMPKYLISHYNIASTHPMEDGQNNSYLIRKMKLIGRASKRPGYLQERGAVVDDGRHKRVWKACERCRTKKIKV
jgi:hypothetical protein